MLTTKMSFEDCEDIFNNIRIGNGNAKISERFIACLDERKLKLVVNKIDWIDFSLKFTNMFPEKLGLIMPKLKWYNISVRWDLSEDFIYEFKDYIEFNLLSKKSLTNKIIDDFHELLNWEEVSSYKEISDENIIKYSDKIDWRQLLQYRKLSGNLIESNIEHIDKIRISSFANPTAKLYKKFEGIIDWEHAITSHHPPCNLFDKYYKIIPKVNRTLVWKNTRKAGNLEEWFIMKYYDELRYESKSDPYKSIIDKVLSNNVLSKKANRSIKFNNFLDNIKKTYKEHWQLTKQKLKKAKKLSNLIGLPSKGNVTNEFGKYLAYISHLDIPIYIERESLKETDLTQIKTVTIEEDIDIITERILKLKPPSEEYEKLMDYCEYLLRIIEERDI